MCKNFLQTLDTPSLNEEEQTSLRNDITENELFEALSEMQDGRSPGNDGLSAEFYKEFWTELKVPFMDSIMYAKINGQLSPLQ